MQNARILWADDEIDMLKAHIMFLEDKGFEVKSVSNGQDAVDAVRSELFDVVFLDENMPGMNGLEALALIKEHSPHTPVVMITKSEEEHIMEDAIGAKISDYLIKPVNPSQILLACKKLLQNRQLVTQKVNSGYQQDFRKIGMMFYDELDHNDWIDIYKKLTFWEMEMEENEEQSMGEVLQTQLSEANTNYGRFVMDNYLEWLHTENPDARPMLSPDVMKSTVFPALDEGYESVFFILVDCMRMDQWKAFQPLIAEYFHIQNEQYAYSILPTATQYCRNSIFAGMMPGEIARRFPKYWKDDDDEGGKNLFEADLLREQLMKNRYTGKHSYHKILRNDQGFQIAENTNGLLQNKLNFFIFNFIDMLSHSRTEVDIIRELAPTNAAYRSLSRSWLEHSPLLDLLRRLAERKVKVILTSDHGSVKVNKPVRIIGDRDTTTNIRYKQGRNLNYADEKYLYTIRRPEDAFLPKMTMSSSYVFTTEDYFFAYPNNYNYYVKYFKDTLQHGGISLEEMIVPVIELVPKNQ